MSEKYFEINGNLDDYTYGLKNYQDFQKVICTVKSLYDKIFGHEIMNRYSLYIDNATENSGYAPITTTILQKYVIIKLGISSTDTQSKIAYQFSHELTHFVFRSYFGLNKPKANFMEETICSAASLIVIKKLFSNEEFIFWNDYVKNYAPNLYKEGAAYAELIKYDLEELKNKISNFKYE